MKNWKSIRAKYSTPVIVTAGKTICVIDEEEDVCLAVLGDPDLAPEAESQGNLMADAPEMLSILNEALLILGYTANGDNSDPSQILYKKVKDMVDKHTV